MDVGGDDIDEQLNAAAAAAGIAAAHNDNESPASEPLSISEVLDVLLRAADTGGAADSAMSRAVAGGVLPTVEIVEQPASKALRFRYPCEGRSAGSLPGVTSTTENKTYPTIRIHGYEGPVTIVVSCVCKDRPFRPHPHNLVGKDRCEHGVCTVKATITNENRDVQFKNLGIQCVKRRETKQALDAREKLRVDPFRTGFDHRNSTTLDLNQLRLAFQVFLPGAGGAGGAGVVPLAAVASDIVMDKKSSADLLIVRASACSGSARGRTQIILLCEKVTKDETYVEFYEESTRWAEAAHTVLVHKQVAILFETPPYRDPHTAHHASVKFRLRRVGSGNEKEEDVSNSLMFEYIPEPSVKKRKTLMSQLERYEERSSLQPDKAIKNEPNRTPPYQQIYSPQSYLEQQQHWNLDIGNPMQSLAVQAGSTNPFAQDMQWSYQPAMTPSQYSQSPSPMPMNPSPSPMHMNQSPSPLHMNVNPSTSHMQNISPSPMHMQNLSPSPMHMQNISPTPMHMQNISPTPMHMQNLAPSPMHMQKLSPTPMQMRNVSPSPMHGGQMAQASPRLHQVGQASPGLQQIELIAAGLERHSAINQAAPPIQQQQQNYQQVQQMQGEASASAMDSNSQSISALLRTDAPLLNSADLLSLSAMVDRDALSESLHQLSTSDLGLEY